LKTDVEELHAYHKALKSGKDMTRTLTALLLALAAARGAAGQAAQAVPPPRAADTAPYLVGAQMCPLWDSPKAWRPITAYPERKPVLGWYDEGRPEVTDWEIKFALEHGISFFLVCWYRAHDNLGKQPVRALHERWITEGLFNSRFRSAFKFCIMWENANSIAAGVASEDDLLNNLLPYWIETFFKNPGYLVFEGKPVLSVYNVSKFVKELGGEEPAARAVKRMEAACQAAGFKGLLFMGQHCWGDPAPPVAQMRRIGLSHSFAYHWPSFLGPAYMPAGLAPDAEPIMAGQEKCWQALAALEVPNIVTVSMGWDSSPWGGSTSKIRWRLTPEQFKALCAKAKRVVDQRRSAALEGRMILIDNWNEYGEGHYVFPCSEYGFGYLDAIRSVFAPDAGPHRDVVPADVGLGPYE
jgi:hypothetical protein